MHSDQTAALGPYCLQYWLPKNISRQEEQTTKVMTGEKRVKYFTYLMAWLISFNFAVRKICCS